VLVVVDNLRSRAVLIASTPVPDDATKAETARLRAEAERDLDDVSARLMGPPVLRPLVVDEGAAPAQGTSSYARADFERDVQRIREYIVAGDAFQVLLARRISLRHDFDSTDLYRALRTVNPSPYMFHLMLDGLELVGSSPELLVRVQDGRIIVRPIAGTRRRDGSPEADALLAQDLLADEKERAEHLMLVDLGRNDVGRVAAFGTVAVTELMVVERYSHVLHLVSEVQGELRPEVSAMHALRASFPAGTMTGAPKVRAMQIIDELEPERRGPYAGAVGYIGADRARMDLAITSRTCVLADGVASVQAGAGIVHDSVPAREWEETESKARALLTAIGRVRGARPD
jgi:anthranilate synthase component 1